MGKVLPILFNTDMVRAILDGRKTVTRRAIKPHNVKKARDNGYCQGNGLWVDPSTDNGDHEGHIKDYSISPCWISWSYYIQKYAPCQTGDILYVRETWAKHPKIKRYYYRANSECGGHSTEWGCPEAYDRTANCDLCEWLAGYIKWRPSIHMPKAAARIWLKVTDVRVEQLRDITNSQILKEGCDLESIKHYIKQMPKETEEWIHAAYALGFSHLWDSTIKRPNLAGYGWGANPWVWVIEFERCEKPEGEKLCQKSI